MTFMTGTFEKVAVTPDDSGVTVICINDDERTEYSATLNNVFIGETKLELIHDEFWLQPRNGDTISVTYSGKQISIK